MSVGCVILAGGKSSRMGRDKALLPIENTNFIEKICRTFDFFEEKMIARGNADSFTREESDRNHFQGWNIVSDLYPQRGPIGGIQGALSACHSEALFVTSCDTPLLKRGVYEKLLENFTPEVDVVIAVNEDGIYFPTCGIYRKSVDKTMEEQIFSGNNKMMELYHKLRVKCVYVDGCEYGLYNINTPNDYEKYVGIKWEVAEEMKL